MHGVLESFRVALERFRRLDATAFRCFTEQAVPVPLLHTTP